MIHFIPAIALCVHAAFSLPEMNMYRLRYVAQASAL